MEKEKRQVLFICAHNSGRSQMAEAFLNKLAGDRFHAESAGLEPKPINPLVIEGMREIGYNLDAHTSDSVFEFFKEGRLYNFVIAVCDNETEAKCPLFAGVVKRLHWPFPDPEKLTGSHEEKLAGLRKIRDDIQSKITDWIKEIQ
jgi:arsenate reductase